jgi:uncharacterized protein
MSKSAFVLDLTTLGNGLSRVTLDGGARDLELSESEWPGGIEGTLDVEKSGDRVSVRGFIEARARLECVRCLKTFELPMRVALEVFAERSGSGTRRDEEALVRDAYMKFHDGRHLDVREDARDALLIEMPIAPRCRDDCAGLCPLCGADLNPGPHDCPGHRNEERPHGGTQA